MSSKRVSPTATLLRNSRLFSLPPPLPRPLNDFMGHVQSNKTSDTATVPYPIQQTVTTTRSALARGDWGLKRALPLRSTTNTSTPLLRINAVDTREHITDFESASDVTLTLQKFQELGLPITHHPPKQRASRPEARSSVFEASTDNTDAELSKRQDYSRWKFHGPWVAGMTQGDFDGYVMKEVKQRKKEFMAFVREYRLKEKRTQLRQAAREAGHDVDTTEASVDLSDEEFEEYIRELRSQYTLGSPLSSLVQNFLDLPRKDTVVSKSKLQQASGLQEPNRTHPSAGLSYLRSDAYLDNHPILGPQTYHAPVEGRVLVAPDPAFRANGDNLGKIGVAGVVTIAPLVAGRKSSVPTAMDIGQGESGIGATVSTGKKETSLGLDTAGGNRIWVEPTAAGIDSRGRIELRTANADEGPVKAHTGDFKDAWVPRIKRSEPLPYLTNDRFRTSNSTPSSTRDPATMNILSELEEKTGTSPRRYR